ncbi:MAG: hypothetical protein ACTSPV_01155 [Candidatus Hodarchaeales archaeon]
MTIKRIKKGKYRGYYGVYHCRNGQELIKAFKSKKQALSMHRAIILTKLRKQKQMARRKRRKSRKKRRR